MEESKEHRCRRELVEALGLDDSDGIHLWDDLLDAVRGYVKIAKSAVSGLKKPDGEYFIPWAKRIGYTVLPESPVCQGWTGRRADERADHDIEPEPDPVLELAELRSSLDVKSALIEWLIGQLTASGRSDSEIREQLDAIARLRSSQPLDPDVDPTCSSESRFPVLNSLKNPDIPTSVPWWLVAPHERQAMRNHGGQTLARLAERGGLSPLELYKIVHDQGFSWPTKEDEAAALEWLRQVAGSESR